MGSYVEMPKWQLKRFSLPVFGLLFFLLGCTPKRPIRVQYVIPKECITSDVICTANGGLRMDCSFDRYLRCGYVRKTK